MTPVSAAIILAAGASARLGQPKQLLELDGEPLIRRAARLALDADCHPVVVVLGACDTPCRAALSGLPVLTAYTPDWPSGMAASLVCGLSLLLARPEPPESVLLLVVDQVQLSSASIAQLLDAHAAHALAATAASYAGRVGVPAILRRTLFPALLALRGDQGARTLLTQLGPVAVPLPEAAADLDTPEDLARLL